MSPRAVDLREMRRKHRFASLVRPHVGLIDRVHSLPQRLGSPYFDIAATTLGDLTKTFPGEVGMWGAEQRARPPGGGSADIDPERSWIRAVVESAERYATIAHSASDFQVESARALGTAALDLERLPRCSEREYADPKCPLHPADPNAPIRWVRGFSLTRGEETLLPAVIVHIHLSSWPAEHFWLPISTGVAAHTRLDAALVSAICENIERDAIALTWLLRRKLPRIEMSPAPELLRPLRDRLKGGQVEQSFFDATTDLRIPTVFSLQVSEAQTTCRIHVSCATAIDPVVACAKTIYEPAPSREAVAQEGEAPANVADFVSLMHGAVYYARRGPLSDFDFLLHSGGRTTLDQMRAYAPVDACATDSLRLRVLVDRLAAQGMEAIAVDLTTDELRDAGLWAVRVVIPELVPVSFVHRARYLGTPRIYAFAARSGIEGFSEEQVNPCPIPFA